LNCCLWSTSYTFTSYYFLLWITRILILRSWGRLICTNIKYLFFKLFKCLIKRVENLWWLINYFCLSKKKFLSSFFKKCSTYLEVKILIWRFAVLFKKFKIRRLTSGRKNCQLFSKHYFIYNFDICILKNY
jgi:hypothetical protein